MAQTQPAKTDHEIYVWNAEDLLEDLKAGGEKAEEGARTALEWNDRLKGTLNADVVAITQLMQNAQKIVQQIKLLGVTGRAYMKETAGKKYIIFKGDPGLRPNLKGTRYLAENPKVRCFVVGSKDILEDAAKGTKVAIIAFVAIDILQEVTSDHPSMVGLGVQITSDVLQAVAAAYIGAGAGIFVASVLGFPVVVSFIAVVGVGFLAGMGLTWLDRKYHLTDRARARMIGLEHELEKDLALARQRIVSTTSSAYRASRDYIHQEAIKADKFYRDAAAMLADSYTRGDNMSYMFQFMP